MAMFINKELGEVIIGETIIRSGLRLCEFKGKDIYNYAKMNVNNPPWYTYSFKKVSMQINKKIYQLYGEILFKEGKIDSLRVSLAEENEDLPKWDQAFEKERKKFYDEILQCELENPPYSYFWGQVSSFYDEKGCSSGIVVRYIY
jgi:hypothetical protein